MARFHLALVSARTDVIVSSGTSPDSALCQPWRPRANVLGQHRRQRSESNCFAFASRQLCRGLSEGARVFRRGVQMGLIHATTSGI